MRAVADGAGRRTEGERSMPSDRIRLGILAAVALLALPSSTLAQTTTSALTRRLRSCGSFLPTSARARPAGSNHRGAGADTGGIAAAVRRSEPEYGNASLSWGTGSIITGAGKPYGCRAHAGFAHRGCDGRRFPGVYSHSRDRIGHQTGRSGPNGCGSHAGRPRDGRSVHHLLDPR